MLFLIFLMFATFTLRKRRSYTVIWMWYVHVWLICRNLSRGVGMCPQGQWEKLSRGSCVRWLRSMSPFDHKLLDKWTYTNRGLTEFYLYWIIQKVCYLGHKGLWMLLRWIMNAVKVDFDGKKYCTIRFILNFSGNCFSFKFIILTKG